MRDRGERLREKGEEGDIGENKQHKHLIWSSFTQPDKIRKPTENNHIIPRDFNRQSKWAIAKCKLPVNFR